MRAIPTTNTKGDFFATATPEQLESEASNLELEASNLEMQANLCRAEAGCHRLIANSKRREAKLLPLLEDLKSLLSASAAQTPTSH